MFLICLFFSHRDDVTSHVRYTLRSSFVHLTLTCTRCGSVRDSFTEHRYNPADYATFLQLQKYVNAEEMELERMWLLEGNG